MQSELKLFSGNANYILAHSIADNLKISMGKALVDQFSDGEVQVEQDLQSQL